jgi:hypothetical protein
MFPWLTLAKYGVVAAIGAYLSILVYATPRIDGLKADIAKIEKADAEATTRFLEDRDAKIKESDDARDKVAGEFQSFQADAAKRAASLRATTDGLRATIAAYARGDGQGLPQAGGTASCADGRAAVLGDLLQRADDLATARTEDAESLAGQVRGLQSYVKEVCLK